MILFPCAEFTCANSTVDSVNVDYSKFNKASVNEDADKFFKLALSSNNEQSKNELLNKAAAKYYVLSNIDKKDIYPIINLARIYGMQQNDKYAKLYFYRALGLDSKNADANFYFAEYYYNCKQYKKALEYYDKALNYGKKGDSQTFNKIGKIYERFGDLTRANFYYKEGARLNKEKRSK